jgi:hypothetical protein
MSGKVFLAGDLSEGRAGFAEKRAPDRAALQKGIMKTGE